MGNPTLRGNAHDNNRDDAATAGLGDLAIGPVIGPGRIGAQRNPGAAGLLAGAAKLAHGVLAGLAFPGRELDDALLGPRDSSQTEGSLLESYRAKR